MDDRTILKQIETTLGIPPLKELKPEDICTPAEMWVDYRKTEPDPFEELLFGVTGKRRGG